MAVQIKVFNGERYEAAGYAETVQIVRNVMASRMAEGDTLSFWRVDRKAASSGTPFDRVSVVDSYGDDTDAHARIIWPEQNGV